MSSQSSRKSSHQNRRVLSRRLGIIVEYALKKILVQHGFVVARIAGSGWGKFPDLVALKRGMVIFFEVKYRQTHNYVNISEKEMQKLKYIRDVTGYPVLIAVKFGNDDFWIVEPDKVPPSTKGHYIIRQYELEKIGVRLSDWLKSLSQ